MVPFTFSIVGIKLLGLCFLAFSGSQCSDVKGVLHKDVLLPCLVVYKDEFDYNLLVVNWQQSESDTVVHSFFLGSSHSEYQAAHYRGRTQLFYELLHIGNVSLLLRNLSKADAGSYTCHTILKQSTGYITQHVNLTVEGSAELTNKNHLWIPGLLIPLCCAIVCAICFTICHFKKQRINKRSKEEKKPLITCENSTEHIIHKYREHMKSHISQDYLIFTRQLLVVEGSLFHTYMKQNGFFGDKNNTINAEKLFTPEKKQLRSSRMLLVGDVGTGKSYLCKWLENKWIQNESLVYKCILYVSCKRIKDKKKGVTVKELVELKYKDLSSVLDMSDTLLILDELDEFFYDKENVNSNMKCGIDSIFDLNTLVGKIITKQLLPETDVLIVSHHDSMNDLHKLCTSAFILQDLTEDETETLYRTISAGDQTSPDKYKSIKNFTYMPAFVVMMSNINSKTNLEIKKYSSPYELLAHMLLQSAASLKEMNSEMTEENFKKMVKQSYENFASGADNNMEPMGEWFNFLNTYGLHMDTRNFEYQSKILRDMLAAIHCVWHTRDLKDCLDFWVFGNNLNKNNSMLKLFAEEHSAKFYHFIRFFMRLFIYPTHDSLFNSTPKMDDDKQNVLLEWFMANIKRVTQNDEKLKIIHCIFELHDDQVTRKLSSLTKEFTLFNTPLNFTDIQALEYYFRDIKLEELDLRLCTLRDRDVRQLRNTIKNAKHVLLSSNSLTAETGTLLEEELTDPGCVIESLALGTNQLGPLGAQAIWRALEHNRSLTCLTFYDNNIGDEGTNGMVEHLQNNNSLKELHLCGNTFGNKGHTNIQELKDKKRELDVVLNITENLELLQFAEERIKDMFRTWKNYNQDWLIKLLETVERDLQTKNCNKDIPVTKEEVNKLIQEIKELLNLIRKGNKPSDTAVLECKLTL